jgi:hypothetical protein
MPLVHKRGATPKRRWSLNSSCCACSSLAPRTLLRLLMLGGCLLIVQILLATLYASVAAGNNNETLTSYQLTYQGHVESSYGVAEGYWHHAINHTFPVPTAVQWAHFHASNDSCRDMAAAHPELYTSFYHATGRPPDVSNWGSHAELGRQLQQQCNNLPFCTASLFAYSTHSTAGVGKPLQCSLSPAPPLCFDVCPASS